MKLSPVYIGIFYKMPAIDSAPVVPLLSKNKGRVKSSGFTSCVLKNRMGRKGILAGCFNSWWINMYGITVLPVNIIVMILITENFQGQVIKTGSRCSEEPAGSSICCVKNVIRLQSCVICRDIWSSIIKFDYQSANMKVKILLACVIIILTACNKDNSLQEPQIKYKSLSPNICSSTVPEPTEPVQIPRLTISVTDSEGDLGITGSDTAIYIAGNLLTNSIDSFDFPGSECNFKT